MACNEDGGGRRSSRVITGRLECAPARVLKREISRWVESRSKWDWRFLRAVTDNDSNLASSCSQTPVEPARGRWTVTDKSTDEV